jgi:hypothetical protein
MKSYYPIVAVDIACRLNNLFGHKAQLKKQAGVSTDKYITSLKNVKRLLNLQIASDVTIETLDIMFGSNLYAAHANDLLSTFSTKMAAIQVIRNLLLFEFLKNNNIQNSSEFSSNQDVYILCAFLETAAKSKVN